MTELTKKQRDILAQFKTRELHEEIYIRKWGITQKPKRAPHIAFHAKDRIIWGTGYTEASALKDAKTYVNDWNKTRGSKIRADKLHILQCSRELIQAVRDFGGGDVRFRIKNGVAEYIGCRG